MTTIDLTYENDNGEEITISVPARMEVCDRCEGTGFHLTPSIGEHAYSAEEFYEEFDEEGQQEYFRRGGIYDVQCEVCHGRNVVPVVDENNIPERLKSQYAEWEKWDEENARYEAESRAEARMERLMGC